MSRTLTINGISYAYPSVSEQGWGTPATEWAAAVTGVINSLNVEGDISSPLLNITSAAAVVVAANVPGLAFDNAEIRSAIVEYSIYRTDGASVQAEAGTLTLIYDGTNWDFTQTFAGSSGVTFSVTSAGVVQYTSTAFAGQTTGKIRYRARVLRSV